MGRYLLTLFLFAVLAFTGCGGMTEYSFPGKGFSIEFPDKWEIKKGFMGTDIMALSPEGEAGAFRSNVVVVAEKLDPGTRADEYYRLQFKSIAALTDKITQFKLSENRTDSIDGYSGKRLVYGYNIGELRVKIVSGAVIKKGTGYVITGTAPEEKFDSFLDTYNAIVRSFRFR